jgi:hypothetical protein
MIESHWSQIMQRHCATLCLVMFTLSGTALVVQDAMAKRVAPPRVKPLMHKGVTYTAMGQPLGKTASGKKGFVAAVAATDSKTGKQLWRAKAYEIIYKPKLETDVQDVWIKSLQVKGRHLIVTNEKNQQFGLDLKTGKPSLAATGPVNGLEVQLIHDSKTTFKTGETFTLNSTFKNVGKKPFSIKFWWTRSMQITELSGNIIKPGPGPKRPTGFAENETILKPGATVQQSQYAACTQPAGSKKPIGWSYQLKPGTYRISMIIDSAPAHGLITNNRGDAWGGKLVSNEVVVVIE